MFPISLFIIFNEFDKNFKDVELKMRELKAGINLIADIVKNESIGKNELIV